MQHFEVIIIGNGPSAITLSYMLDGNWPYYDGKQLKGIRKKSADNLNNGNLNNSSNSNSNSLTTSYSDPAMQMLHARLMEPDESELNSFVVNESKTLSHRGHHCRCLEKQTTSETESFDSSSGIEEDEPDSLMFVDQQLIGENENKSSINLNENGYPELSTEQILSKSIVERNLEYLSSNLTGRSLNPISLLFDQLEHPGADFGKEQNSSLIWKHDSSRSIKHLVIGRSPLGGAWSKMDDCPESLTISLGSWMQLPNYPIQEWSLKQKNGVFSNNRIRLNAVSSYYRDYVCQKNLKKNFQNECEVESARHCDFCRKWLVTSKCKRTGKKFKYTADHLVLASGNSDKCNRLQVTGEHLPFVLHSFSEIEHLANKGEIGSGSDPVLIIGGGLSAADAILAALDQQIPVLHVFRKHPDDPSLVFNQLPEAIYPEYQKVHAYMKSNLKHPLYRPFAMHCVNKIRSNHEVELYNIIDENENINRQCFPTEDKKHKKQLSKKIKTTVKVSFVLPLIGWRPDLSFLKPKKIRNSLAIRPNAAIHPRSNPIKINPFTHESTRVPRLYAMGPLTGDNFVRFCQGSALAILAQINSLRSHQL